MFRIVTILLTFTVLLTLGCKPDPDPPTPTPPKVTIPSEIRAGVVDSGMVHQQFIPAKELPISYDSTGIYGTGSAMLDVDMDGFTDLEFHISIIHPDSYAVLTAPPTHYPIFQGIGLNGFKAHTYVQSYYVGLGATVRYNMADTLHYQSRIDLLADWDDSWWMWTKTPGWGTIPPVFGEWYFANSTFYMAIHRAGYQYGWIEIDNSDVNFPKINSCAYWPTL